MRFYYYFVNFHLWVFHLNRLLRALELALARFFACLKVEVRDNLDLHQQFFWALVSTLFLTVCLNNRRASGMRSMTTKSIMHDPNTLKLLCMKLECMYHHGCLWTSWDVMFFPGQSWQNHGMEQQRFPQLYLVFFTFFPSFFENARYAVV